MFMFIFIFVLVTLSIRPTPTLPRKRILQTPRAIDWAQPRAANTAQIPAGSLADGLTHRLDGELAVRAGGRGAALQAADGALVCVERRVGGS